jgi:hypothetical protein
VPDLKLEEIERYLPAVLGEPVNVFNMTILGGVPEGNDVKG